jgi:hypothetical protein
MTVVLPFRRRAPPAPPTIEPDIVAVTVGGLFSALNLTGPAIIKASPGRLCKLSVIDGGSINGVFSINDCATIDAADETNRVFILPFGARAGTIVCLDWPMGVGITLSAVPDGTPIIAVSFS